jgi:hypothetical protein
MPVYDDREWPMGNHARILITKNWHRQKCKCLIIEMFSKNLVYLHVEISKVAVFLLPYHAVGEGGSGLFSGLGQRLTCYTGSRDGKAGRD